MEDDVYEYARQMGITLPEAYTVQGCTRTGCQACGFGISKSDDNRLDILYKYYPKYYDMVMKIENNGVTFRQAVRKVLAVVGKHLPDETPKTLFDYDKI